MSGLVLVLMMSLISHIHDEYDAMLDFRHVPDVWGVHNILDDCDDIEDVMSVQ
jgi:hypothetical protein